MEKNSTKIVQGLQAISEEIDRMTPEQLDSLLATEEKAMIEAIVNDKPHIGLSMWLMDQPVEASAYIKKVKAGEIA